jgi:hypothetical protein
MAFFVLLLSCFVGCAQPSLTEIVSRQITRSEVRDAKSRTMRDYPWLRADSFVLEELAFVRKAWELDVARESLQLAVHHAFRNAEDSVNLELDRLDSSELERIWSRAFKVESRSPYLREDLRRRFWADARDEKCKLNAEIDAALTPQELHGLARRLRRSARSSPKDQHGHGLLLAIVSVSVHEQPGSVSRGGQNVDIYAPGHQPFLERPGRDPPGSQEDVLLARFAPIIVQERLEEAPYDQNADQIGTVRLCGTSKRYWVDVDTTRPAVYGYWQYAIIGDRRRLQLNYVHWFPEHPKRGAEGAGDCGCAGNLPARTDLEAGRIDGGTLRITLDRNSRPAILETVLNCGCYHRCFPLAPVEAASCSEFGTPLQGKKFCVERKVSGKIDWNVPETVAVPTSEDFRPILFSRAGYHGLVSVSFDPDEVLKRHIRDRYTYSLIPYLELERLPLEGLARGMFDRKGLVQGAERLEGKLLAVTGMLSAGQPRQRETQRILWDDYDWDDPRLLEKCLRLPRGF